MNLQEYISTGIVESYVLGLASEEESREFEELSAKYPEILAIKRAFEEDLEKHTLSTAAIPPPADGKLRFLETIGTNPSNNQSKIVNMENNGTTPMRKNNGSRFTTAAAVILLAGCAWFAYRSNIQKEELKDLKAKLNTADSVLNQIAAEQKTAKEHTVNVVNMVGTEAAPKSSANVFWDSTSQNVYMVVKNMPKLPNDKQYQLWALIDGKPKDLGVFDVSDQKFIIKMKNTQKADAFAITIEQKGGSPSPTLEKMQSMGKTKEPI
ncbi:MAG TPA: anti-sigma factor [Chitinophaga sp.]|nr:anti-sigma factor [Chitinophaga sp.]